MQLCCFVCIDLVACLVRHFCPSLLQLLELLAPLAFFPCCLYSECISSIVCSKLLTLFCQSYLFLNQLFSLPHAILLNYFLEYWLLIFQISLMFYFIVFTFILHFTGSQLQIILQAIFSHCNYSLKDMLMQRGTRNTGG